MIYDKLTRWVMDYVMQIVCGVASFGMLSWRECLTKTCHVCIQNMEATSRHQSAKACWEEFCCFGALSILIMVTDKVSCTMFIKAVNSLGLVEHIFHVLARGTGELLSLETHNVTCFIYVLLNTMSQSGYDFCSLFGCNFWLQFVAFNLLIEYKSKLI